MSMNTIVKSKTREISCLRFDEIDFPALIQEGEPCIIRGALQNSSLVTAGKISDVSAMEYLLSHNNKKSLLYYSAIPEANGRLFYNTSMNGFNFSTEYLPLSEFFKKLEIAKKNDVGDAYYIGSAELIDHFPDLLREDQLELNQGVFEEYPPRAGIWIGNRTTAATHYDVSNNIAACLVGRRRFTLFPPEQVENLYPGPLEPTPGGQVVSMFNPNAPDFKQYPKAKIAIDNGQVAELSAGDILVYPAMWWHQVEALDSLNIMINYWWNTVPSYVDDPMSTLLHAMLSLRGRPKHEREAWRAIFDFYIFDDDSKASHHLPAHAQGLLGPLGEINARRLRSKVIKRINR